MKLANGLTNPTKKSARADYGDPTHVGSNLDCHLAVMVTNKVDFVKYKSVEVAEFAPAEPWVTIQVPYSSTPTPNLF